MPFQFLLLPLAAAAVYALGSILIKRALKEGATMDQSFHLTNLVLGLIFLPLLLFDSKEVPWNEIGKPMVMGITFFAGHWLTFVAIRRGDVSMVTPLKGTKVVFVAVAVVILTGKIPSFSLWVAAVLTTLGIFVMGLADLKGGSHVTFTVLVTLASALVFGVSDVLVSWWARGFGALGFLAIGSATVSICSLIMWMVQGAPRLHPGARAISWTGWGAIAISFQALAMGLALSFFKSATGINVVYASRGLWVIVFVVVFGKLLGNSEHHEGGRGFLWRIAGTILLTVAIVIAVMDRTQATGSG